MRAAYSQNQGQTDRERAALESAAAVSGAGQDETPESLAAAAFAGCRLATESGAKTSLPIGTGADRKNFDFLLRRGIMAEK